MLSSIWRSLKSLFGGKAAEVNEPTFDFGDGRVSKRFEHVEEIEGPGGPLTALEAFEVVGPMSDAFDATAQMVRVASGPGIDAGGRSTVWVFSFQFPERWSTGSFIVKTGPPGSNPASADESVTFQVEPFPSPGSAMAKMLASGQSGFVEQQWKMELERTSALPLPFKDSAEALALWKNEGLNLKLSATARLKGLVPPLGGAVWRLVDPESGSKKRMAEAPFH